MHVAHYHKHMKPPFCTAGLQLLSKTTELSVNGTNTTPLLFTDDRCWKKIPNCADQQPQKSLKRIVGLHSNATCMLESE